MSSFAARAQVIPAGDVSPRAVFDRYFSGHPPFNSDKKKARKSEFPDAFVLEAVHAWCSNKRERAYLVSRDSDWSSYCGSTVRWFDDAPVLIPVETTSQVVDLVLRNDAALVDQTTFADNVFNQNRDKILKELIYLLGRITYREATPQVPARDLRVGVAGAVIQDVELVAVTRQRAQYRLALLLDLIIKPEDPYEHRHSEITEEVVTRKGVTCEVYVTLKYADGLPANVEEVFETPSAPDVDLATGEVIKWSDWIQTLPVIVCGVSNGVVTDNGQGVQHFSSLQEAQRVFPDLSVTRGSSRFTHAMGDKLVQELRFETWRANEFYST